MINLYDFMYYLIIYYYGDIEIYLFVILSIINRINQLILVNYSLIENIEIL